METKKEAERTSVLTWKLYRLAIQRRKLMFGHVTQKGTERAQIHPQNVTPLQAAT